MKFIVAVILAGLLGVAARADEPVRASKAAVRKEIIGVIDGQLAAFRAGDVARAYAYASLGLQRQTSPQRFARVVREGYPEIWTNTRAEFGIVRDDGERATLTVRIYAESGESATYDYVLLKEEDVWRIAGVLRHDPRGRPAT